MSSLELDSSVNSQVWCRSIQFNVMFSIASMILDLILLHFYVMFIFSVFSNNINDVSNSDVDNSNINAAIEYLIANTNFTSIWNKFRKYKNQSFQSWKNKERIL